MPSIEQKSLEIDTFYNLCINRVGLEVGMVSSHAEDPGSIPGLDFSFDKTDLVVSILIKIMTKMRMLEVVARLGN